MPTLTTLSEPARDIRDSRHLLKLGSTANGHALENLCIGLARLTERLVAPLYALCANSGCEQVQQTVRLFDHLVGGREYVWAAR